MYGRLETAGVLAFASFLARLGGYGVDSSEAIQALPLLKPLEAPTASSDIVTGSFCLVDLIHIHKDSF